MAAAEAGANAGVQLVGRSVRRSAAAAARGRSSEPYGILVTGIGGTGVITIGALLGMAAHLEGKGCSVLDFTGLAQKNGAVMSHVRIAAQAGGHLHAVRIAAGGADLLLGCDMVVRQRRRPRCRAPSTGVTKAVINADMQPTASFVINPDIDFERRATMQRASATPSATTHLDFVDAHRPRHGAPGRLASPPTSSCSAMPARRA